MSYADPSAAGPVDGRIMAIVDSLMDVCLALQTCDSSATTSIPDFWGFQFLRYLNPRHL
jgi:hypothetical protein